MRPVQKPAWPADASGNPKSYKPHTGAKPDLEDSIGSYCSYCEEFQSSLQVEHVISVDQDDRLEHHWDNFLLACGRCNGRDNKSNKHVDFSLLHFPHRDNTLLSLRYREGGLVEVNPELNETEKPKAKALLKLVGLDKYPGNPDYPTLLPGETRWKTRKEQWEFALRKLAQYESGDLELNLVVEFAQQRGYFSVWFAVFESHPEVRAALIKGFKGTPMNCFDASNSYRPVPRT